MFDFTNDRLVLAGTVYGEARGGGAVGMQNVAQVILNRHAAKWAPTVAGVCLARLQFSCWNSNDPNRQEILAAAAGGGETNSWKLALSVADLALAGHGANNVAGADSYFARSMHTWPFWAKAPARQVASDPWHYYWLTRPVNLGAPNVSMHAQPPPVHPAAPSSDDAETDKLNDASAAGDLPPMSSSR